MHASNIVGSVLSSYSAWSGFSALNFLNPIMYQLFNIILAFWPIIWFGLFDKSTRPRKFYENKEIYRSYHFGHENGINFRKYLTFNGKAILVSFINFYVM